ncbi:tRNA-binding protein [Pseudofulvibacter geojedonensis]|uniref:tRNA-binding protein n=1 Tax=Pseudofulvibacter geojedonensis TaxID=1123758 RepID=A0ABW3I2Q1_9FLAO
MEISWSDFEKIDIRIGTIVTAQVFEKARRPAYILEIDFGDLGVLKSSAQITDLYNTDELVGKQVVAVVNFPKKQIANIMSECLVLGGVGGKDGVVLLQPEQQVSNGTKIA